MAWNALSSQLPDFQPSQPTTVTLGNPLEAANPHAKPPRDPLVTGQGDLDLDLDFSLDDTVGEPAPQIPPPLDPPPQSDAIPTAFSGLSEFEETPLPMLPEELPKVDDEPLDTLAQDPTGPTTVRDVLADNLDFSLSPSEPVLELDLPPIPGEAAVSTEATAEATRANNELMSFDLGSLSLDLGEDRVTMPGEFVDETMDPLETKLALADEFRAIGDDDGARALIEEVIAEAAGDLRSKAQSALAKL